MKQLAHQIKNTSYEGKVVFQATKSLRDSALSTRDFIIGLVGYYLLPRKTRLGVVTESHTDAKQLLKHALYPFVIAKDVSQLSSDEIESLMAKAWKGDDGIKWSKTKFDETRLAYNFDLDQVSPKDTYYLLYQKLTEIRTAAKKSPTPLRILEIGCSMGRLMGFFAGEPNVEIHGIDLNEEVIKLGRKYFSESPNVHFHHGDAVRFLKNLNTPFDYIYLSSICMYMSAERLRALLEDIHHAKKTKNILIFESIASEFDLNASHTSQFEGPSRNQLCYSHNYKKLLSESGFRINSLQYAPIWLARTGVSEVRKDVVALLMQAEPVNKTS